MATKINQELSLLNMYEARPLYPGVVGHPGYGARPVPRPPYPGVVRHPGYEARPPYPGVVGHPGYEARPVSRPSVIKPSFRETVKRGGSNLGGPCPGASHDVILLRIKMSLSIS